MSCLSSFQVISCPWDFVIKKNYAFASRTAQLCIAPVCIQPFSAVLWIWAHADQHNGHFFSCLQMFLWPQWPTTGHLWALQSFSNQMVKFQALHRWPSNGHRFLEFSVYTKSEVKEQGSKRRLVLNVAKSQWVAHWGLWKCRWLYTQVLIF